MSFLKITIPAAWTTLIVDLDNDEHALCHQVHEAMGEEHVFHCFQCELEQLVQKAAPLPRHTKLQIIDLLQIIFSVFETAVLNAIFGPAVGEIDFPLSKNTTSCFKLLDFAVTKYDKMYDDFSRAWKHHGGNGRETTCRERSTLSKPTNPTPHAAFETGPTQKMTSAPSRTWLM